MKTLLKGSVGSEPDLISQSHFSTNPTREVALLLQLQHVFPWEGGGSDTHYHAKNTVRTFAWKHMTKLAVFKNAINIFCAFLYFKIYLPMRRINFCLWEKKTKPLDSAPACSIFRVIFWSSRARADRVTRKLQCRFFKHGEDCARTHTHTNTSPQPEGCPTWWTNTSTGSSSGTPSRLVMDRKPKPMRTLNHLHTPVPWQDCESSSVLGPSSSSGLHIPAETQKGWGESRARKRSLSYSRNYLHVQNVSKKTLICVEKRGGKKMRTISK